MDVARQPNPKKSEGGWQSREIQTISHFEDSTRMDSFLDQPEGEASVDAQIGLQVKHEYSS